MKIYWSQICNTPKYLVELYQASIKNKEKEVEINFIENDSRDLFMHALLNISEFFINIDEETNIMN
jgi:hypothetical protein